jgi:O-antigen ligase
MKGLILLIFFFSQSIFFCTLSLFSLSYTGGGNNYAFYSLVLAMVIGAILLSTFIKKLMSHEYNIPVIKIYILFIFFILLLGTIYSYFYYGTEPSKMILLYYLAFTAPAFFISLMAEEKDVEVFYKSLKYLNIYLSFSILIAFLKTIGSTQFDGIGGATYLLIGYTMAFLFSYNFFQLILERRIIKKLFYIFMMIFNISMILLSGSRGAVISVAIISLFIYYQYIIKSGKGFSYTVTLSIVACVTFLFLIRTDGFSFAWYRISRLFESDFGIASSGRDVFYQQSLIQFQEHPLSLTGIGAYANHFGSYVYPHNIILEILNDFGLIGFLIASFIISFVLYSARDILKHTIQNQYIVILFIQSSVMLMVSGSYLTEIQFWIPLVLILTFRIRIKHGQKNTMAIPNVINQDLDSTIPRHR